MSDDLSIQDVAERCDVTRQTVHVWLTDGLPSRMVFVKGRRAERRIKVSDLERWLRNEKEARK